MSDANRRNRVTRADVARLAGVSVATVSYVLTGRKVLPQATRDKVVQAVEQLGYYPDLVARSMSSTSTKQLGVLAQNIDNPFYSAALAGIEEEARLRGHVTVVGVVNQPDARDVVRAFLGRRVDGVIIVSGVYRTSAMQLFLDAGVNVVTLGFETTDEGSAIVPSVVPDHVEGTRLGVEHLLDLGHTRIGLLPGRDNNERLDGWVDCLGSHGLSPAVVSPGDYTYDTAFVAAEAIIDSGATAALVGNDYMALALLGRAMRKGLRVPEDLSIVGYDGIWMTERSVPSLTTVDTTPSEMGRIAARIALGDAARGCTRTSVQLVSRESTGPYTR